MQTGQRSRGVFYWGLRVLFFSLFKVFVMMLNVSRGFMFWAVFCMLNQCYAFTDWEQNVLWDLLQLKCLSVATSYLPQAWQCFFGGLPRRFLMSQLYAKEKSFLYLILEMLHLKSSNVHFIIWYTIQSQISHSGEPPRGCSRGRRICGDIHFFFFFSKCGTALPVNRRK